MPRQSLVQTEVLAGISVIVLSLWGCQPRQPQFEALLSHTKLLHRQGHSAAALAEAEQGMQFTAGRSTLFYWQFLIEKAELLQLTKNSAAALETLAPEPPSAKEFGEVRARRDLDRGFAALTLTNYAQADEYLRLAYQEATSIPSEKIAANVAFVQAQLSMRTARPAEAEERIRIGTKHAQASGDRRTLAYGYQSLADLLNEQGNYEDALIPLTSELALHDSLDITANAANLIEMGLTLQHLGQNDKALELYRQAEKFTRQTGDIRDHQIALGNIGDIYLQLRKYETARPYFEEALKVAEALDSKYQQGVWLSNLARVAIAMKDWSNASAYNNRALAIKGKFHSPTALLFSLNNSARILEGQGKSAEAEQMFLRVARSPSTDPVPLLSAHAELAKLYATQERDQLAEAQYDAALRVVERSQSKLQHDELRITFLSSLIVVYSDYIDFLMSRGRTERALAIAEASRARILQQRLGSSEAIQTVNASAYRNLARESGATLLSYWLGPDRSYLWLTTPRKVLAFTLPPAAAIRQNVANYRGIIEGLDDPLQSDDASGRELFEALLSPVADQIPPGSHLIVVPDGALNALNFETLPVRAPQPHYFIEDASISVAPSLNLLVNRRPAPKSSSGLLLVGDPDYTDDSFPKLLYAGKEIEAVLGHFPSGQVREFTQAQARPSVYLNAVRPGFDFVHFTAHASANRDAPLDSAIILSGPAGKNKLTAREVLTAPLNVSLVTISACRSAGAMTYAGEGLVGFMWAFFRAGARNIIAGLWDVSDESTPLLMDRLYAGLTQGVPPAEALRNAKLAVMKTGETFRLPYYWGPFQLYVRDFRAHPFSQSQTANKYFLQPNPKVNNHLSKTSARQIRASNLPILHN